MKPELDKRHGLHVPSIYASGDPSLWGCGCSAAITPDSNAFNCNLTCSTRPGFVPWFIRSAARKPVEKKQPNEKQLNASPDCGLFWVHVVMLGLPSMKNSRVSRANTGLLIAINPRVWGSFLVAGLDYIYILRRAAVLLEGNSDSQILACPTPVLAHVCVWRPLFSPDRKLKRHEQLLQQWIPLTQTRTRTRTRHCSHQLLLQLTGS